MDGRNYIMEAAKCQWKSHENCAESSCGSELGGAPGWGFGSARPTAKPWAFARRGLLRQLGARSAAEMNFRKNTAFLSCHSGALRAGAPVRAARTGIAGGDICANLVR